MFFMVGTWPGKKDLGTFEGYNVYMTFTSIVIFFIPLFKCGKQYFAEKNGRTYQLDPEVGRQLERGEEVPLRFTGEVIYGSNNPPGSTVAGDGTNSVRMKICMRCKYRTDNEEFTHCPMCGNKLVHE